MAHRAALRRATTVAAAQLRCSHQAARSEHRIDSDKLRPLPFLVGRQSRLTHDETAFSSTSLAKAVSEFKMPSMSPTMESGKISSWKVKEGDSFSAGDVLLTVETDKAEVDVEAQDDGIVGKIILDENESSIQVGKTIALLAEEGDDISNLTVPKDDSPSSPSASSSSSSSSDQDCNKPKSAAAADDSKVAPKSSSHTTSSSSTSSAPQQQDQAGSHHHSLPEHTRPLLPSVVRLLVANGSPDISGVKGTGLRGQLTKGDILAFLGKVDNPSGSAKKLVAVSEQMDKPKDANKEKWGGAAAPGGIGKAAAAAKPMSGKEFRRWITAGLAQTIASQAKAPSTVTKPRLTFEDVLEGYLPATTSSVPSAAAGSISSGAPSSGRSSRGRDAFDDILGL